MIDLEEIGIHQSLHYRNRLAVLVPDGQVAVGLVDVVLVEPLVVLALCLVGMVVEVEDAAWL